MTIYGLMFSIVGGVLLLACIVTVLMNIFAAIYLGIAFPEEWNTFKASITKVFNLGPRWFQAGSYYFQVKPKNNSSFYSLNNNFKCIYTICDNCLFYLGILAVIFIIVCRIFDIKLA